MRPCCTYSGSITRGSHTDFKVATFALPTWRANWSRSCWHEPHTMVTIPNCQTPRAVERLVCACGHAAWPIAFRRSRYPGPVLLGTALVEGQFAHALILE